MAQNSRRTTRSVGKILFLSLILSPLAACGILETEDEIADEARVVVSGTASNPLLLITSTKFERFYDEEGEPQNTVVVADTVTLDLPAGYDQIFPVKPDKGFLVRLVNPETEPAVISIQVYFDGELSYDQKNVSLSDASVEFSYIFENFNTVY